MERYDSMMRAARHVIGAGTFAAAMLALTAASASAQTSVCEDGGEGIPTVCGHVFTDTNSDGNYDAGEGTPEVSVVITDSTGAPVGNSPTPSGDCAEVANCGFYGFQVFEDGDYWICIVAEGESADCRDSATHPETVKVTVTGGDANPPFVDFEVGGGEEEPDPNEIWGVGTGTPGYWKNHPEAWPAAGITIGGVHYTVANAIAKMGKVSGDKTYSMFAALVSAVLNTTTLSNNPACISETIGLAQTWMAAHPVGSNVKASSAFWAEAQAWHQRLDDYNNGKLCAPHRG
jgi:hypothetical protein